MADIALVHSRLLGPSSWEPLARELEAAGHRCVAPEPDQPAGHPTPWHELPETLVNLLGDLDQPAIVCHSGGGLLAAPLAAATDASAIVFLDARIPPEGGTIAPAEPEFVEFLRDRLDASGLLPPWSRWWGDDVLPALIDDPVVRQRLTEDEPLMPIAWFEDTIEVPAGWAERPISYIRFSEPYDPELDQARSRDWPVATLDGSHLHHINAPTEVARHIARALT